MLKTAQLRNLPVAFHKIERQRGGLMAYSGVSTLTALARRGSGGKLWVHVPDCDPLTTDGWRRLARQRVAALVARSPSLTREASLAAGVHGAELTFQQLGLGQLGGSRLRALTKARSWTAESAVRRAVWLEQHPEAEPGDLLLAEFLMFLDLADSAL